MIHLDPKARKGSGPLPGCFLLRFSGAFPGCLLLTFSGSLTWLLLLFFWFFFSNFATHTSPLLLLFLPRWPGSALRISAFARGPVCLVPPSQVNHARLRRLHLYSLEALKHQKQTSQEPFIAAAWHWRSIFATRRSSPPLLLIFFSSLRDMHGSDWRQLMLCSTRFPELMLEKHNLLPGQI